MTDTEISLFGSLPSFTALFSTPLSGVLLDVIGRKKCCILFGLPSVIAWTIVSLVSRVEAILASVCVGGLSGCLLLVAPNFISEFSHESIRGTLTSFGIIFYGIGLMVSYILGGCLNYEMMNYVCLTISVFSLVMMSLVKESPVYLMSKDLEKKAAESIAFYTSTKQGSVIVQQEMESIRRTLNQQVDRLIVVQVYSEPLFKEALPNMSANLTSILFALLNTISGFVAAYLLDVFGRRVRGVITMLVIEWGWLCNFFILFIFNPFIAVAGLGPVFYVFAFIGLVSAIFCKHYLPETKGLTVDAIQDILLVT
ncbi:facilitated trehalose transporter Tret1 like protein [Danaus plexippus plexippus]|uniref:Facilitated trehalose transporter Tret1 like protein n=1 Tax=Danaus plexippus plexippus TaxID=278856 RepID=A0A212F505_DANPL|nr:facilitated trehalose transporter Tret1 like protein [Danaus plexippus plexippus]